LSQQPHSVNASSNAELPFWAISVALHALMIGSVLMFAPVREIVFRRKIEEPEVITRGDELEQVIEQIRDRTVEKLRSRVNLLEAGQERMATNFATLNEFYQPFVEQQRATARERMEKYIAEVLPRQDELRKLIEAARNSDENPAKAVAYAHEWVSRILTGQEEVRRGMQLLELGGTDLLAKQKESEEAQYQATQFMRWLDDSLRVIDREAERLAGLDRELAEREAVIPEAEKSLFDAKVAEKDADLACREAEARRADLAEAKDREGEKEAKKAVGEAKNTLNAAQRRVSDAAKALQRANDDVKHTTGEIDKARKRLEDARAKRDSHLKVGFNIQNGAYYRQKDVVDTIRQLLAESADDE